MEPILPYIDMLSKLSAPALVVLIVIFLTVNHSKGEERDNKIYSAFIVMIQGVLDNFSETMRELVSGLKEHDHNAQGAIKGIARLEQDMSEAQRKMFAFADHQDDVMANFAESVKTDLGVHLTDIANRLINLQEQVDQVSAELIALSSDLSGVEGRLTDTIRLSRIGDPHDRNPDQSAE